MTARENEYKLYYKIAFIKFIQVFLNKITTDYICKFNFFLAFSSFQFPQKFNFSKYTLFRTESSTLLFPSCADLSSNLEIHITLLKR